jgi:hypothetical protein
MNNCMQLRNFYLIIISLFYFINIDTNQINSSGAVENSIFLVENIIKLY